MQFSHISLIISYLEDMFFIISSILEISVTISFRRLLSSLNISWYSMFIVLFSTLGQFCRTCSCGSGIFEQNRHVVHLSLAFL